MIEKIVMSYPDISTEWLLRGEGDMLNIKNASESNQINSTEKDLNEELISQTLLFFNLKNRGELQSYLKNASNSGAIFPLEQMILKTWENKYGQELKTIKLQLMTLFTSQLDYEMKSDKRNADSKIV